MTDKTSVEQAGTSIGRTASLLAVWAVAIICGLWLMRDATTYALRPADLSTGRPTGCYTALDIAFRIGPSEGGFLTGTRLLEVLIGLPAVAYGLFAFVRRLWRSAPEVPLISLVALLGTWLAGKSFFWRFHDTDVYFTWRIIGNTPNEIAENVTASIVVTVNVLAMAWVWRTLKQKHRDSLASLRVAVYAGLLAFVVALLLRLLSFPKISVLLLLAVPALFLPTITMLVHGRHTRAA